MFSLLQAPSRPRHVVFDDLGIPYARASTSRDEPVPIPFSGPARPDDRHGPPWATLVFGLETGLYGMRERYLQALQADAAAGKSLVRYGDALEAAFSSYFGGRGANEDTPGFLQFVRRAMDQVAHPAARAELTRGKRDFDTADLSTMRTQSGAPRIRFPTETGHFPADHPSVMYWLSRLAPEWPQVYFDQATPSAEDAPSFTLKAWCEGKRWSCRVRNFGDHVDAWGCAGFTNVLLRDALNSDLRVWMHVEDEVAMAIVATCEAIRRHRGQWRRQASQAAESPQEQEEDGDSRAGTAQGHASEDLPR